MRTVKIVADSSADVLERLGIDFGVAPLKINTDDRDFVDDATLDVHGMVTWFDTYKGKSKTSCPNSGEWLEAFGDAEEVFCVTITSGLSGSYNSACAAGRLYEEQHPGRRVHVVDSLSAGPELVLIIEKLEEYICQGLPFEEIREQIEAYKATTGLVFMLASLKNFAANGRISPAKIVGVLGIRIVGIASREGTLEPIHKPRGEAKALKAILNHLVDSGLQQGKVWIAHCENPTAADTLAGMLREALPQVTVQIHPCRGLCSYYAEKHGMLVGFEKF